MIELVEDSLLFTGDIVAYQRILRLDDGSFRDNIVFCDKAINLKLKHYVPGHGKTGDVSIVKLQKEYLSTLYTQVGEYYKEGLEAYEIKPKVVEKLAKFHSWSGFDSEVGKQVSQAVLEIEQSEFE